MNEEDIAYKKVEDCVQLIAKALYDTEPKKILKNQEEVRKSWEEFREENKLEAIIDYEQGAFRLLEIMHNATLGAHHND